MRNQSYPVGPAKPGYFAEWDIPLLHEDDPERDMGEANVHALSEHILRYGVAAHLAPQILYRVFSNMNLHYQPKFPRVYISPDVMVVTPTVSHPERLRSYRIGKDGPVPRAVAEILSEDTAQDQDLEEKVSLYAVIGVPEYLLVDVTGQFLPQRLLLKRLQADQTWEDRQDADGGITSQLGFRVIVDEDGQLRVRDAKTGKRYVRPEEAQVQADAAEDRIIALEKQLARLRGSRRKNTKKTK